MTEKHLTVLLYGSDRNLWSGGPLQVRVTDIFAAGGPKLLHRGRTDKATIDLRLDLPFDAGQVYGFDFSAPGHHPAWQLVRRSDFLRLPDGVEGQDAVLRLMLVPDEPGTRDLGQGFQRLQQRGSPMAADGCGLDERRYEALSPANRMALLNIEAKLRETFVDGLPVLSFVKAVRHVAVDRLFLLVDPTLKDRVARAADFAGAAGHGAPDIPGGSPAHPDSWKHRRFAEGNVQLSFSADTIAMPGRSSAPVHSVDVDIDLGRGLAHVVEWLDNNVIRRGHKTDQALIYGLLYAQRILPVYTLAPVAATTAKAARLRPVAARSARGAPARRSSAKRARRTRPPAKRTRRAPVKRARSTRRGRKRPRRS